MPKDLPGRLPEGGDFAKLKAWLNDLREYVATLRPQNSFGTRTQHTSIGVLRQASPAAEESAPRSKATWRP